jgi:two-component system, LytTR family, sensor kinase
MRFRARPWMLASAVWIIPALFATIEATVQWRLNGWDRPSLRDILFSGGDWLVYGLLTPPIFWAAKKWPVARPHFGTRAWLHIGFALLFCVFWAVSGKILQAGLAYFLAPDEFAKFFGQGHRRDAAIDLLSWIFTTLPFGVIVYLCIAGMAHALQFFVEANEEKVQVARLNEQLAGARFAALQAQVNPHFLFNTLNTIVVRARDGDNAGTVQMVEQLSEMLRRTLTRHRADQVTLEEELDLVRQYVGIEQARFSDRLAPTFDIAADTLRAAVPSFAIQHLVENAIRHGIARRAEAGVLRIGSRRVDDGLIVTVEDDGPGISSAADVTGGGLYTTRERLKLLYGDRASLMVEPLATGGTRATLRIPYKIHAREENGEQR